MKLIHNSSRLAMLAFVIIICITGCKSKKKAAEASNAAAEKAKIEREEALRRQKDEELRLAEQQRKEADERSRREAAEKEKAKASAPAARLGQYFSAISNASTPAAANSSISEALALFASPETPVLIVISESGGQKDYDRPTTIRDYLNYLKDQKKNANKIGNLQFDGSGKITEVELTKN